MRGRVGFVIRLPHVKVYFIVCLTPLSELQTVMT